MTVIPSHLVGITWIYYLKLLKMTMWEILWSVGRRKRARAARVASRLEKHGVPTYFGRVVGDYLRDRMVEYADQTGSVCEGELHSGVPQGSVLGPLLEYRVRRGAAFRPPPRLPRRLLCKRHARSGREERLGESLSRGEVAAHSVVRSIRDASLTVAANKTEALFFYSRANGPPK